MHAAKPGPDDILRLQVEHPQLRERDFVAQIGVSEADLVAAKVGVGARRIEPRVNDILRGLGALGEVMALTRNASAVHEKIGVYDKPIPGNHVAMMLGADIDMRIFPKLWVHGFAVEKLDGEDIRRSLQFFDAAGDAVHKVHLRPTSNVEAYEALVTSLLSGDQSRHVQTSPIEKQAFPQAEAGSAEELRQRWGAMTDVHQFFGMLRELKINRRQALEMVGDDYAWALRDDALSTMLQQAAASQAPIMCFIGNHGCIQIHSGPVETIKVMGPWINILDAGFHMHLRLDHIHQVWAVRKPTKDGHVTSLEAYDANEELIIQFFGQRKEGEGERSDWRELVEALPRIPLTTAA